MFHSANSLILFFGLSYVLPIFLLYCMAKKEQKNANKYKRNCSDILYRSSNTDSGVPVNKVFQTLKDAGIEPNYLGAKGENLR